MATSGINGTAVFAVLAGSVLAYSGLKGRSISGVARSFLEGKGPESVAQTEPIVSSQIQTGIDIAGGGLVAGEQAIGGGNSVGGVNASGQLSFTQISQYWILAGGPPAVAPIAAAITMPESGRRPSAVQQGQPYATTGWGLWQITPGNSVPSVGTDQQLLDPLTNARAAVAKYHGAGNSFRPWVTYENGAYLKYVGQA